MKDDGKIYFSGSAMSMYTDIFIALEIEDVISIAAGFSATFFLKSK